MVENKEIELTEHEAELYDRQIRLWGLDSQKRLRASKIFLSGLSGVGAEIAKNIILAGVKSVVLQDNKNVTKEDSCSQFLIPVTAIGENRAEASLQRARALNPMVEITADTEELDKKTEEYFKQFDVIIITGAPTKELLRINNICRENNLKFFACDVWGMFGYSFEDLVEHDFVEEVMKHKIIEKKDDNTVKTELVASSRKSNMKFPSFQVVLDFTFTSPAYLKKMKRSGPAYVILRVLQEFRDRFNRDPFPETREEDYAKLLKIRDEIAQNLVDDSAFLHVFAQISPAAAVVGGQLAQEVIKAVSQKDPPFRNVFLFDPENCCGFIEEIGVN